MMSAPAQPDRPGDSVSRPGQVSTPGSAAREVSPDWAGSPQADVHADDVPPAGATPRTRLDERRSWRIEFPAGMELVTSNARGHWRKFASTLAEIKAAAVWLCRQQKIPHLARASFVLEYQPPTKGRAAVREAHNLTPVAKAGIDGVVVAGVITDDADRYVSTVSFRRGERHPGGRVVLIITEEPENPS